MNAFIKALPLVILLTFSWLFKTHGQQVSFKDTTSFYPNAPRLQGQQVKWGYLSVPENWDDPQGKHIAIAVAVLKNTSHIPHADGVVFIQGGPGAGGIPNIWNWLSHPLREKNDIILFDVRGTSFSKPRLCPDLGKQLLEIFAKNQSGIEDEKQKVAAAVTCKQDMLDKGIDVNAYHSLSVAKDLHALRTQLNYGHWNVYGVSYGTYMAQVYASTYPNDVRTLILDSPVADVSTYYTRNTGNYMHSLTKVFELCKKDPVCNKQYPDLEQVYYKTIAELQQHPVTVTVDKKTVPSGIFTYNADDFKLALQQALYNKQLVEVIPLLIYQFHNRNEAVLKNLVTAFSGLLMLDYGVYYCVSCNEVLPNNSVADFADNTAPYKNLKGGLSFYQSDFKVCDAWNKNGKPLHHDLSNLSAAPFPVLVFSGGFDPITPRVNAEEVVKHFARGYLVKADDYGHAPSFTKIGYNVANGFVNNPGQTPDINAYDKAIKVHLVKNVTLNKGIFNIGTSLNKPDLLFLAPLMVAFILMLVFAVIYLIKLLKKKYTLLPDKIVRILTILTSVAGIIAIACAIYAIMQTATQNFYIMAFGLPVVFHYVFTMMLVFAVLLLLTLAYFILRIKKIHNRSMVFSVIFSNILLSVYLLYWGII